ncbi:39S ribosomal protein L35, mitochondrial [Armadillidium nasatum]|uniref:Large ribosomal subunit protein bL35m n=1 Tax=Armadillidium nasatum TaxID=96803 RepID=A0A5N5SYW0_9CRUS|nr:39S ribosomal protein L35, mitochondrial [Armadillidium nasatum]
MNKTLNIISRIASTIKPYAALKESSGLIANKLNFRFLRTGSLYSNFGSPHPVNICKEKLTHNQLHAQGFCSLSSVNKPMLENSNSGVDNYIQSRSIIKYSFDKGEMISDPEVLKRFKRLDWGIWIRPKAGATKKLWRKKAKRVNRLSQIVFCNATQSRRLDKMVSPFWRKPRVYPDDPYAPYLKREDFWQTRETAEEYPRRK